VHRPSLSILVAIVIFLTCSQRELKPSLALYRFYTTEDREAFTQYVNSHHAKVRRQLDSVLFDFVTVRAMADSAAGDSLLAELIWLCTEYENVSGVSDKTHKLELYRRWSQSEAQAKLTLDSIYQALESQYRLHRKTEPQFSVADYLQSLKALSNEYAALHDSFYMASIDFNLARTHYDRRNIDSTLNLLSRSKSICKQLDYHDLAGDSELLTAKVYNVCQADYLQAERALLRAIKHFRKVGLNGRIAYARSNQAYDLLQLYQIDRAIDGFHAALKSFTREGNKRMEAYCELMLGEAYYDNGDLDSARVFVNRSLVLQRRIAEVHPIFLSDVGLSISCLGLIAQAEGNDTEASKHYTSADAVFRRAGNADGLSTNNLRLASLLVYQKEYVQAQRLYRKVLEASARFEDDILALYGLAVCDYYTGRTQAAIANLRACLHRLETKRQKLPIPEIKTGMLSDKIGFYHLLAIIFIEQFQRSYDTAFLDSAFHYLERSKSQTLREMLLVDRPAKQYPHETALIEQISGIENALILGQGDSTTLTAARLRLEDSLHTLRIVESMNESNFPDIDTIKIPELHKVHRHLLTKGEVLFEYLISDFGSYLFVVTEKGSLIQKINVDRVQLEQEIASFILAINRYPSSKQNIQDWRARGQQLYSILVPEQLVDLLDDNHLIIVATGMLHYLPFGALIDLNGHFLIERCDISYAPSITTLSLLKTRERPHQSLEQVVAFGDPLFGNSDLDPLPHSRKEVESLVDIFGPAKVRLYLGEEATETNFTTTDYGSIKYLHVATHGVSNDYRPEYSALLFASEGQDHQRGLLQASEIGRLDIPVDLVFLSACRSGSGRSFPGEGVLSLYQPFLVAGSNSVVVSYWNVNDNCSVGFVRRFYSHLNEGLSKAQSLALTKREMLRSERDLYRHPYFWAPYVVIGL